jgi:hypothetical protein
VVVPVAACGATNLVWLGDGYCDSYGVYNTAACNYDGGDCCAGSCPTGRAYSCGFNGWACVDPSASAALHLRGQAVKTVVVVVGSEEEKIELIARANNKKKYGKEE